MASEKKRRGLEDLKVYEVARNFRKRVYKLARILPAEEKHVLSLQMRRAALSLTNNIAEGYCRYSYPDMVHFCRMSRGSLGELTDDINTCMDEGYARQNHLQDLKNDAANVLKLLNGYIRYLREQHRKRTTRKASNRRTPSANENAEP
jgi:four helix bundle protein